MLDVINTQAIGLTLKLAVVTTILLITLCLPLAWWLTRQPKKIKNTLLSIMALPLVVPPTVLGFYLLVLMGPDGWGGAITQALNLTPLPFSFAGLVLGSMVFSLPFTVHPLYTAFNSIGQRPFELAATYGAGPWARFLKVGLPLAKPGILTATVLCFAHTVGEFGVVLMLGGNIPGETQVLSIAIYDHVEAQETTQAHILAAGLVAFSFTALLLMQRNRKD